MRIEKALEGRGSTSTKDDLKKLADLDKIEFDFTRIFFREY